MRPDTTMTPPTTPASQVPKDWNPDGDLTPLGKKRCTSKNREGLRCGKPSLKGQDVCDFHGGNTPQAKAAAQRRLDAVEAAKQVERFSLRRTDITPSAALLEELQWTAGNVEYFRQKANEVGDQTFVLAATKIVEGPHGRTRTVEERPSIWYELWMREREHLVKVASACVKAGVEQRRIELAEQQGLFVANVVRRILDAMLSALLSAGVDVVKQWDTLTQEIVPREFRAIEAATREERA